MLLLNSKNQVLYIYQKAKNLSNMKNLLANIIKTSFRAKISQTKI